MQWETSCVTGFAHCHQDQKLNDSRVYLSLKLCFVLGFFCQPVCQWVFVLNHFGISPPSKSCSHCSSCSQWQHLKDQMWDMLNDRHESVAAGGMRKNQRYFCTLLHIFYFVESCTFEGNCLLWTIQPISKHTVSSFPYNIQHKPSEFPLCIKPESKRINCCFGKACAGQGVVLFQNK